MIKVQEHILSSLQISNSNVMAAYELFIVKEEFYKSRLFSDSLYGVLGAQVIGRCGEVYYRHYVLTTHLDLSLVES